MVLQVLIELGMYANISKYIFYQRNIHYLVHIISVAWIEVDPKKIEAIR
jgi:hypothetical protein